MTTFVIGNYLNDSIINLNYTLTYLKVGLQRLSEIILNDQVVIFICPNLFSNKLKSAHVRNIFFWLDKWNRGVLSSYKTSYFLSIRKKKSWISRFPNFLIFVDSTSHGDQLISKEATYLGIFSFGFVDTQSNVNGLPYWSLCNNKSNVSISFYYYIVRATMFKAKALKIKNFFA